MANHDRRESQHPGRGTGGSGHSSRGKGGGAVSHKRKPSQPKTAEDGKRLESLHGRANTRASPGPSLGFVINEADVPMKSIEDDDDDDILDPLDPFHKAWDPDEISSSRISRSFDSLAGSLRKSFERYASSAPSNEMAQLGIVERPNYEWPSSMDGEIKWLDIHDYDFTQDPILTRREGSEGSLPPIPSPSPVFPDPSRAIESPKPPAHHRMPSSPRSSPGQGNISSSPLGQLPMSPSQHSQSTHGSRSKSGASHHNSSANAGPPGLSEIARGKQRAESSISNQPQISSLPTTSAGYNLGPSQLAASSGYSQAPNISGTTLPALRQYLYNVLKPSNNFYHGLWTLQLRGTRGKKPYDSYLGLIHRHQLDPQTSQEQFKNPYLTREDLKGYFVIMSTAGWPPEDELVLCPIYRTVQYFVNEVQRSVQNGGRIAQDLIDKDIPMDSQLLGLDLAWKEPYTRVNPHGRSRYLLDAMYESWKEGRHRSLALRYFMGGTRIIKAQDIDRVIYIGIRPIFDDHGHMIMAELEKLFLLADIREALSEGRPDKTLIPIYICRSRAFRSAADIVVHTKIFGNTTKPEYEAAPTILDMLMKETRVKTGLVIDGGFCVSQMLPQFTSQTEWLGIPRFIIRRTVRPSQPTQIYGSRSSSDLLDRTMRDYPGCSNANCRAADPKNTDLFTQCPDYVQCEDPPTWFLNLYMEARFNAHPISQERVNGTLLEDSTLYEAKQGAPLPPEQSLKEIANSRAKDVGGPACKRCGGNIHSVSPNFTSLGDGYFFVSTSSFNCSASYLTLYTVHQGKTYMHAML